MTHAGQQARVEIDKPKFEEITKHLLDRTIALTHDMLRDAEAKGYTKFDKIILVGGATRMPQVRDRIVAEFHMEPDTFDPDEAVAKGAALFGLKEALQDQVKDILTPNNPAAEDEHGDLDLAAVSDAEVAAALDKIEREIGFTLTGPVRELVNTQIVNVLSKSLGVVAKNPQGQDNVVYLLNRNSEVPMESQNDFGTETANQLGVNIRVMAGERDSPEPDDCKDVGTAQLTLPSGLPALSPIRVKFAINRDGRLSVTATDLTGGGSIDVEFETEAVMGAGEVRRALDGAEVAQRIVSRGGNDEDRFRMPQLRPRLQRGCHERWAKGEVQGLRRRGHGAGSVSCWRLSARRIDGQSRLAADRRRRGIFPRATIGGSQHGSRAKTSQESNKEAHPPGEGRGGGRRRANPCLLALVGRRSSFATAVFGLVAAVVPNGSLVVASILAAVGVVMLMTGFVVGAYGAFQEDFLNGMLYLFFPIYTAYFIASNWDGMWRWFLLMGGGAILIVVAGQIALPRLQEMTRAKISQAGLVHPLEWNGFGSGAAVVAFMGV